MDRIVSLACHDLELVFSYLQINFRFEIRSLVAASFQSNIALFNNWCETYKSICICVYADLYYSILCTTTGKEKLVAVGAIRHLDWHHTLLSFLMTKCYLFPESEDLEFGKQNRFRQSIIAKNCVTNAKWDGIGCLLLPIPHMRYRCILYLFSEGQNVSSNTVYAHSIGKP